ncbi:hypothetical protein KW794_00400 [Candidatus Saccharibacteria bacterium]|nr:hypothetical protein [Candidatus Saccharibacteria bacterium]
MPYEALVDERLEEVVSEPEIQTSKINQNLRLIGEVAMPPDAKEVYFLALKGNTVGNQLIIPHYAYPFNSIEVEHIE